MHLVAVGQGGEKVAQGERIGGIGRIEGDARIATRPSFPTGSSSGAEPQLRHRAVEPPGADRRPPGRHQHDPELQPQVQPGEAGSQAPPARRRLLAEQDGDRQEQR